MAETEKAYFQDLPPQEQKRVSAVIDDLWILQRRHELHPKELQNPQELDYLEKMPVSLDNFVANKLEHGVDLLFTKSITQSIYDKKVYELKNRQREIEQRLSSHTKADKTFHYILSVLIELTARAHECFMRVNIEQKRKLITLLCANLEMQCATLYYSLQKPFDVLAQIPESEDWRALVDTLRTDCYQDVVALLSYVRFVGQELLAA